MKIINIAGLVVAAAAIVASGSPASAADLYSGQRGGSIKDDGYAAAAPRAPAGPCYFRGDVGYSWSRSPEASWPVSTIDQTTAPTTYTYIGDSVSDTSLSNVWFGGVGLGCSSGSRGIRGELMLNQSGSRNFQGTPQDFTITQAGPTTNTYVDPIHTSIKSTTLMFNGYKDLGSFGGITPYVGAGVGVAYNKMGDVSFTGNPFLTNTIEGGSRLSLAWSLMAGVGYQISDRAILDLGYRYMDYGKAESGRIDSAGAINPAVKINDFAAHEFKVGLRYHFGASDSTSYQPMK